MAEAAVKAALGKHGNDCMTATSTKVTDKCSQAETEKSKDSSANDAEVSSTYALDTEGRTSPTSAMESDSRPETPTGQTKRRGPRQSMAKPVSAEMMEQWRRPFTEGWGREIVYRNTSDGASDVYYFAPDGKKLRSLVEIEKHLDFLKRKPADGQECTVNIDCFTFRKETIHCEPFEIVRTAGGKSKAGRPSLSDSKPGTPSPTKMAAAIKRIKTPANSSAGSASSSATTSPATPHPIKPPIVQMKIKPRAVQLLAPAPVKPPQEIAKIVNVAKKHTGPRQYTGVKRKADSPLTTGPLKRNMADEIDYQTLLTNIPKSVNEGVNDETGQKMCNFKCPLAPGQLPTMQCDSCMCLFHPVCMGQPANYVDSFKCKLCSEAEQDAPAPRPAKIIQATSIQRPVGTTIIITTRPPVTSTPDLPHAATMTLSSIHPRIVRPIVQPINIQPEPQMPVAVKVKVPNKGDLSGQVITLPSTLASKLNFSKALNLKLGGVTYHVPPSCVYVQSTGVKVFLPPRDATDSTIKRMAVAMKLMVENGSQDLVAEPLTPETTQMLVNGDSIEDISHRNSVNAARLASVTEPAAKRTRTNKRYGDSLTHCSIQKLNGGFDCLLHVFEYLPLPDLLRTARVCRTWRQAVSQSYLWKVVRLNNVKVVNWQLAAEMLQKYRTEKLDLRKLYHAADERSQTWLDFEAVLPQLKCVKELEFGECPPSVIQSVTSYLPLLESLVAEAIVEPATGTERPDVAKLDIGTLAQLNHLQMLKLRGKNGISLPVHFSGPSELASLLNLRVLILTNLRDFSESNFEFLGSLKNLEQLEIGSVNSWSSATYSLLSNLTGLKSLYLQCGGDMNGYSALGEALESLKNLVELRLTKFVISSQLSQHLQKIQWLKELCIWPDTELQGAQVNSNTLAAACSMANLKHLEWGILDNSDSVIFTPAMLLPTGALVPETMSINQLAQQLTASLPNTKIRVFKVPITNFA